MSNFLTLQISKNRTTSGNVMFNISPPSLRNEIAVVKKKHLHIDNFKISKICDVFNEFYDSVPTVNTDTSLPISFDKIVCTFPNTRYSFFMYNSVAPMIGHNRYYEDSYYNELESNPFPYGYEHEECFAKHSETYGRGTNHTTHIKETNKIIKWVPYKVIISYVKKVNTYIVRSEFLKEDDPHFINISFFKQNEKLFYRKKKHNYWNSPSALPNSFAARIRKHLKENNLQLYQAIEVAPATVCQYRTVLNNQFWRKTSATYLLNKENKNARRRAQNAFKKSKVSDPLEVYNLPNELKAVIQDSFIELKHVTILKNIFNKLILTRSEFESAKHIKDLIALDQLSSASHNLLLVQEYLDNLIALNCVGFTDFDYNTLNILFRYFHEYSQVDPKKYTSVTDYLSSLSTVLSRSKNNTKSTSIQINGKTCTINPTTSEVIKAHVDTKFNYFPPHYIHTLCTPDVILNGKPISNISSAIESFSFSEVISNADILVANKLLSSKPYYKEQEITTYEDFF